MSKIASFLLILLVIVAALFWVTHDQTVFAFGNNSSSLPPSISLSQFTPAGTTQASQATSLPNFDGGGVVFLDTADGSDYTPYLAYEMPKGGLGVKELIFLKNEQGNDTQPCQVSAGEYPCTPDLYGNDGADSDASPVPSGTVVHVVGGVDDQAIVVQSMSAAPALPSGIITFSTSLGSAASLSNGISIKPVQILTDASCTLGVGCYGTTTQRLETILTDGNSTKTTEIVPGTIFTYNDTSIILLSISGTGSSATANFLASKY